MFQHALNDTSLHNNARNDLGVNKLGIGMLMIKIQGTLVSCEF